MFLNLSQGNFFFGKLVKAQPFLIRSQNRLRRGRNGQETGKNETKRTTQNEHISRFFLLIFTHDFRVNF